MLVETGQESEAEGELNLCFDILMADAFGVCKSFVYSRILALFLSLINWFTSNKKQT